MMVTLTTEWYVSLVNGFVCDDRNIFGSRYTTKTWKIGDSFCSMDWLVDSSFCILR